MAGEEGALVHGAVMLVVAEICLLAFLFAIFVMIAGQKIFAGHLGSLVLSRTFICPGTTTLESHVVLVSSNM